MRKIMLLLLSAVVTISLSSCDSCNKKPTKEKDTERTSRRW
jgi:hypothetical protein